MSIRGHHVRGAFAGLLLGFALTIMLTLYGVVRLAEMAGVWITLAAVVFGVAWSFVAPAPRARKPAPEDTTR